MLNGIDDIDLTAPDAKEQINALAKGLIDKNADLLGKLSSNKEAITSSAAEIEALRQFKQNADVKLAEEAQSYQEAKELAKKAYNESLEKAQLEADNAKAQLKTLLIDNGLSSELDGVDINKNLKAGAVAILKPSVTISDGKAMVGDKSLSDTVKEWAETDIGKSFCLAPNNSGGDANGGTDKGTTGNSTQQKLAQRLKQQGLA